MSIQVDMEQMPKAKPGDPRAAGSVVLEQGRLCEWRLTTVACCLGLGKQEQLETPGSKWLCHPQDSPQVSRCGPSYHNVVNYCLKATLSLVGFTFLLFF